MVFVNVWIYCAASQFDVYKWKKMFILPSIRETMLAYVAAQCRAWLLQDGRWLAFEQGTDEIKFGLYKGE